MSNLRAPTVLRRASWSSSKSNVSSSLLSVEQEARQVPIDGALPEDASHPNHRDSSDPALNEDEDNTTANQSITRMRGMFVAFALACLIFIQSSNISMLTTIQSEIAQDLNVYEQTSWFTSVYLIAMSALGPLNGKLSSIFSPRACIVVASIVMALGAVLCAIAKGFEVFLIGRTITGIGASGVFTISIIIVLELTSSKYKGIAIGSLNSGYTFGVAVGATAAGALVEATGWRALFWLQAPVVIFGGTTLLFAIPKSFTAGKKDPSDKECSTWDQISKIDYLGALTLTGCLILFLYALSAPKSIPALPIILSVIVGVIFVLIETYWASDPIIPVSLLRSRGLLLTCLGTVGYMMSRWSVLFYTPTFAIAVRQWSRSAGGAMLIPTNFGFAAGGLTVGALHIKRHGSFYLPTLISYALFPITMFLLATMANREGSAVGFVVVLFFCGFTTGAALNYNLAHLLHLTPNSTHYVATALIATFRGFAGSFGSAIGGGLFTRTLSSSLTKQFADLGMRRDSLVRKLLGAPQTVVELSGVERDVAIQGYEDALKTLWYGAAILAVVMVFVQAGVGVKGHEEKINDEERQSLLEEDDHRETIR